MAIGNTSYQKHIGILGGSTVSAAEPDYSVDSSAMLASMPAVVHAETISTSSSGIIEEGIMETALFSGMEFGHTGRQNGIQILSSSTAEGPYIAGYFAMPAKGFNWGRLHPHNAVDIANNCGTKVTASADGLVIETSAGKWNGGYGDYVLLSHPNSTKTRYAHLEKVLVSVGQRVNQGEVIGLMGKTGNATGCHVHFEIIGAANPFAFR
ncbi:MAG TPA: M23 family metallopeptidase [Candidatus Paceibacterota bacterium]|nr:M23 family metallopeptidase [Candidatus Paceibacterota bacterium]